MSSKFIVEANTPLQALRIKELADSFEPVRTCRIVKDKDEFGWPCWKCTSCGDLKNYDEVRLMKPGDYCIKCGAEAKEVEND